MNPYSEDLRKKIVKAVERGMPKIQAARTFGAGISSVKRCVAAAREGRSLAPKKRPGSKPKLDEGARRLLEADLEERSAATLPQRREFLERVAGYQLLCHRPCSTARLTAIVPQPGWHGAVRSGRTCPPRAPKTA
jgi:transposase